MDTQIQTSAIPLAEAAEFIWLEADLLDGASYDEWLALWTPDARYVVPVEPGETDFANTLNYAYDDAEMRKKRVERMLSGMSISASPVARTVRLSSRFRMVEAGADACEVRCAQFLTEFRRERQRYYTADVEFSLVRDNGALKIDRKVVRLINAGDVLAGISYIL